MSEAAAPIPIEVQSAWDRTCSAVVEPDQTIPAERVATRSTARAAVADGIRRLGYEIGGEIARGGLGIISRATQQVFDRPVAIKRLRVAGDRLEAMRFFAEAVITAKLEHPNIVPIHDLLSGADGQLQLAMKLVKGLSWRDLLHPKGVEQQQAAARISFDDHLDILLKVCDAVSFAHGQGILHRDLKPENIMVGSFGEVLVMDWGCGIAFGEAEHHPVVPRVEEAAEICGTPSYIAPEMALMDASRMGPHSDVYLLGGILYEVLTRLKPHRGANVRAVLMDAASGRIQPPHEAAPGAELPEELATIAMAALEKDPRHRIRTADELAQRLKAYRAHAQAVALLGAARGHLARARTDGSGDSYRRAVSAAEQACAIWPQWEPSRRLLLDATIGWSTHHLGAGDHAQALVLATQAAAMASKLKRDAAAASALQVKARAALAAHAARQRQLRLARIGFAGAGAAFVAAMVVVVVLVSAAERRTAQALARAQQTLYDLDQEHAAHSSDQRASAPALVAEARKKIEARDWDGAVASLRTAIIFDGALVEARSLLANTLAAAGRYEDAIAAAQAWARIAPASDLPQRVEDASSALLRVHGTANVPEASAALARLFEAQQLFSLTTSIDLSPAVRLEFYRAHLDAAWPDAGKDLEMRPDGMLRGFMNDYERIGGRRRASITSLEPLRGMPFAELNLIYIKAADLRPLAGMPLAYLSLSDTSAIDLTPLSGMPLQRLNLTDTQVSDLSPLADMPLRELTMVHTMVHDLTPLRRLPLELLNCMYSPIADLSLVPKAHMRILACTPSARDLSYLHGMLLRSLRMYIEGDLDLSPLAGSPLVDFEVESWQVGTVDASALPSTIRNLKLRNYRLASGQDLRRLPLETLQLDANLDTKAVIDLRLFDLSHLRHLTIRGYPAIDLSPLHASPLADAMFDICGDLDLAPLAATPIVTIHMIGNVKPQTWRSLSALKQTPRFKALFVGKEYKTAVDVWKTYDPEHPPP